VHVKVRLCRFVMCTLSTSTQSTWTTQINQSSWTQEKGGNCNALHAHQIVWHQA
jgi:hypothetical protein